MDDAANHPTIINTRLTGLAARQMWFDHGPSFIRQPKQIPHLALQVSSNPKSDRFVLKISKLYGSRS
jgi:hypothetical protein